MLKHRKNLQVYVNGVLMREGEDYTVVFTHEAHRVKWSGFLPVEGDQIEFAYTEYAPSAVDLLAEITLSMEERRRRRERRRDGADSRVVLVADELPEMSL